MKPWWCWRPSCTSVTKCLAKSYYPNNCGQPKRNEQCKIRRDKNSKFSMENSLNFEFLLQSH